MNYDISSFDEANNGERRRRTEVSPLTDDGGFSPRRTEVSPLTDDGGFSPRRTEVRPLADDGGFSPRRTEVRPLTDDGGFSPRRTEVSPLTDDGGFSPRRTEMSDVQSNPNMGGRRTEEHSLGGGNHGESSKYDAVGRMIDGRYKITQRFPDSLLGGEAVLYFCEDVFTSEKLVAKIYAQDQNIDFEARRQLNQILNTIPQGVVHFEDEGFFTDADGEHYFEIMPYYSNGSMAKWCENGGIPEERILTWILPRMLVTLRELHKRHIYHLDIKPENIVLSDDKRELILIDFGVARKVEHRTAVVSKVVGTEEYRAPETYQGILCPESDYYSLGVTLFTLRMGYSPKAHIDSALEAERDRVLNGIPKPDAMSDFFYRLFCGMTYVDIDQRGRRGEPGVRNRWVDREINMWLQGVDPEPWVNRSLDKYDDLEVNISFSGVRCQFFSDLVFAMLDQWERGADYLMRSGQAGLCGELSRRANTDFVVKKLVHEIEEFVKRMKGKGYSKNAILFQFSCIFLSEMKDIYWMGNHWDSLNELGEEILNCVQKDPQEAEKRYIGLLREGNIEIYLEQHSSLSPQQKHLLETLRNGLVSESSSNSSAQYPLFRFALEAKDDKTLHISGIKTPISTPSMLKRALATACKERTVPELTKMCRLFTAENGQPSMLLNAWLDMWKDYR